MIEACLLKTRSISASVLAKHNSTSTDNVYLYEAHGKEKYAVLKFNKPPVNSLNLEALLALNAKLDEIEETKEISSVILTSVSPRFVQVTQ